MKFLVTILAAFLFLISATPTAAIINPLATPNNKYGIHIVDENDLENAAPLVNTSGDWGYVTMVITQTDRSKDKWQKVFDQMRNLHLIPIIRIATRPIGDRWEKPKMEDAKTWADFLNNLYWVTKNRYVILFNEPNHANEWGGTINPSEYAEILKIYSLSLKQASADFFVLPAGLDASAPNGSSTMDEVDFLREMVFSQPDILLSIDGWASHSYPNPGFSGKVTDTGRGTLQTYLWEFTILKSLGLARKLPVFITETGWAHREGSNNKSYYPAAVVASFMTAAAQNIWNDEQIVAITPFILNYQSYPFSQFSWALPNRENEFYPFYYTYKSLAKVKGSPVLNRIFPDISFLARLDLDNKIAGQLSASLFSRIFNL